MESVLLNLRDELEATRFSEGEDLDWWPFSGHRPDLNGPYRSSVKYVVYKALLNASRGGWDVRGEGSESVCLYLKQNSIDPSGVFFATIRISPESFRRCPSRLGEHFEKYQAEWVSCDSIPPTLACLRDFVLSWQSIDASSFLYWIVAFSFLDRKDRVAFFPFLTDDYQEDAWRKRITEPIVPLARFFLGASDLDVNVAATDSMEILRILVP
ncbi:MAG: hypothetical protein EON58_07700 [Alphaproteobacteria bacterium]|nr:MAG: hypothetical protein EON58_07700 [Alphaproteobacteria bacterium]